MAIELHGPVVNLNGAERQSLIDQHIAVARAADDLLKALGQAFPHGRDYQTARPGLNAFDRNLWEGYLHSVDEIQKNYQRVAERLATEKL